MSRDLGGLTNAVAATAKTFCTCVRFDLRNGESIGLTNHDRSFTFAGVGGSLLYSAETGILPSEIVLRAGLDPDNCDLTGPIGETFSRAGLLGGKFRGAVVRIFLVSWRSLHDYIPLMMGSVGRAGLEGRKFTQQIFSAVKAYEQSVGSILTPKCRTFFGSPKCTVVREEFDTTITAVTSTFQFTVDVSGISATNFRYGSLQVTSGDLNGLPEDRFLSFDQGSGVIEMWVAFPTLPQVGDALTIFNGCSLLSVSADVTVPTCLSYDNMVNFRGFRHVPSSSVYNRMAVPGNNGA